MTERPILITGGAGFIGTNLAHRLLQMGQSVFIYDNLSRPGVEQNLDWLLETHGGCVPHMIADIRDEENLEFTIREASVVFHLAAQVAVTTSLLEPRYDLEVNTRGTLNVLEALRALGSSAPPLVFTSTNKVYGSLRHGASPIDETRPLDFCTPYACSKGAADQYVLDYARTFGLHAVVFRMSCIYGPHQQGTEDQGWVAHFLRSAIEGKPITIYGDGQQVRDVLYVDDLVDALMLAHQHAERLSGEAFNIGGGIENTLSLLELIDLIGVMQRKPEVSFKSWRVGDQRYYVSDIRKFQDATGWVPTVGVREGVGQLYAWLCSERVSA